MAAALASISGTLKYMNSRIKEFVGYKQFCFLARFVYHLWNIYTIRKVRHCYYRFNDNLLASLNLELLAGLVSGIWQNMLLFSHKTCVYSYRNTLEEVLLNLFPVVKPNQGSYFLYVWLSLYTCLWSSKDYWTFHSLQTSSWSPLWLLVISTEFVTSFLSKIFWYIARLLKYVTAAYNEMFTG